MAKTILPGNYGSYETDGDDRRSNHFRIDKSISLGNILTILALLWTIVSYGNRIVDDMKLTQRKTLLMWNIMSKEHPELERDLIR